MSTFEQDVTGIGSLADPIRRALYLFVRDQPEPVSRDQAAEAVGVAQHQAKFHLDRLEKQGLLESGFARTSGRTGPGAGRTAKLYRPAGREFAVSLPDREYELAGQLMAEAIATAAADGEPILEALDRVASRHGRTLGAAAGSPGDDSAGEDSAANATDGGTSGTADSVAAVIALLRDNGYQPHWSGGRVILNNCPFHGLVRRQPELVCRMNCSLLGALSDELTGGRLIAELSPAPDRCCVVLSVPDQDGAPTADPDRGPTTDG